MLWPRAPFGLQGPEFEDIDEKLQESLDELLAEANILCFEASFFSCKVIFRCFSCFFRSLFKNVQGYNVHLPKAGVNAELCDFIDATALDKDQGGFDSIVS